MSIPNCTAINTTSKDPYRIAGQDKADQVLLKLPNHILGLIGSFVATGATPAEAARNGVLWSWVCVCTHVTSHEFEVDEKIQAAHEDDALLKMWDKFNFDGKPPLTTLADIKAWFTDPENAAQLNDVTMLNLSGLELKAIPSQITKFTQLQKLNLSNNQITDISALSTLVELSWLNLSNNRITDISALSPLVKLAGLYLPDNRIAGISALSTLAELRTLILSNNQITDILALRPLSELSSLDLSNNRIAGISALRHFDRLSRLILTGNPLGLNCNKDELLHFEDRLSIKILFSAINETKNYECESKLSKFIQFIAQESTNVDQIQEEFSQLDEQDRNLIYAQVNEVSGNVDSNTLWAEHHTFDDMAIFNRAVRLAISTKFEHLSQDQKTRFYSEIFELAGSPETNDGQWGEHHAFDNVLRLIDAMKRVEVPI